MEVQRTLFTGQIYVFDTSSFIDLNARYPKVTFPSIWNNINELVQNNQLYSHVEVLREIKQTTNSKDKLLLWAYKNKQIFVSIDNCQMSAIDQIKQKYIKSYFQNQLNRLSPWADPYIIAISICEKAIIVTQEHKTKENRIPPIAAQFGIKSLNLLEFFQELEIKL